MGPEGRKEPGAFPGGPSPAPAPPAPPGAAAAAGGRRAGAASPGEGKNGSPEGLTPPQAPGLFSSPSLCFKSSDTPSLCTPVSPPVSARPAGQMVTPLQRAESSPPLSPPCPQLPVPPLAPACNPGCPRSLCLALIICHVDYLALKNKNSILKCWRPVARNHGGGVRGA